MTFKSLLALVVLLGTVVALFLGVRKLILKLPRLRYPVMAWAGILTAIAGVVGLWLPGRVSDTPGSPAALVFMLVLWFFGGTLFFFAAPAFLGAVFAWERRSGASGNQ